MDAVVLSCAQAPPQWNNIRSARLRRATAGVIYSVVLFALEDSTGAQAQAQSPAACGMACKTVAQASIPPARALPPQKSLRFTGTFGCRPASKAAMPETWAAENEVPLTRAQRPPGTVVGISWPGASTIPGMDACAWPLAAAITPGYAAGKPPPGSCGSTAATTVTPRA